MKTFAGESFTSPEFLRRVGRNAVAQFFAAFAADIHAGNVILPDPSLPDDRYFQEAARFLEARRFRLWLSPNALPVCLRVPSFGLEPLRTQGADALLPPNVPAIVRITLCQLKVICSNGHCQTHTSEADDLFKSLEGECPHHGVIPRAGRLARATLRIQFADSATPRTVVLCPPETIQLLQESDAEPVKRWLAQCGFQLAHG
jgi:hypothetical protein